jgi:hypothetical protein
MTKPKQTKRKTPQAKKTKSWFVPVRGSYLPASAAGWWTYVPYLGYSIFALVVGIDDTKTKALAVLFIVPNWVAATAVMTYVAARKS